MVTEVREVQEEKAPHPISITVSGMVMMVREVQ
jgi:hypothetical protein